MPCTYALNDITFRVHIPQEKKNIKCHELKTSALVHSMGMQTSLMKMDSEQECWSLLSHKKFLSII